MTTPHSEGRAPPAPGGDTQERLIESLLLDLEQNREPDVEELRRRFADSPETVAAMLQVLSRFKDLRQALRRGERPPKLAPGERLGDFQIHAFLQRGAVGEVYRASQLSLRGRQVALKVIPALELTQRERERFLREAEIAAHVHHPHLVAIYASGEDPERGLLYYAMRLVEGPTFRTILEERSLLGLASREESRIIVQRIAEVASALAALHAQGLVHRDVKPSNIMLAGAGPHPLRDHGAVLVDYGLLRPFAAEMTGSTLRLTVAYAAPEQLLGKASDPRTDVFALGIVLHDLLRGRLPEDRSNAADGLEPIDGGADVLPDRDLVAVVRKATEAEPEWRYSDAADLEQDLRAWLEGHPVSARPPGPGRRAAHWIRTHPARVLRLLGRGAAGMLVTALVVVSTALLIGLFRSTRRAEAAWNEGNLEELVRAIEAVPAVVLPLLLPTEVRRFADELRTGRPSSPAGEVVRLLANDRAGGTRLAAAHVERDGLARSPVLGRFLLNELTLRPAATVPLLARLFMERPDATPEDVHASRAFRARLLETLESSPDDLTAQFCLTALSGCATPREAERIAEWAWRRSTERGPPALEDVRLVHAALSEVLFWRAPACGFLQSLKSEDLDRVLAKCRESIEALGLGPLPENVARGTTGLFLCLENARRLAGLEVGTLMPAFVVDAPQGLLAARRDPALRTKLLLGPEAFDGRGGREAYLRFGVLVGSYGEPELTRLGEGAVRSHATLAGVAEPHALASFRIGVQRSAELCEARDVHHLPDEDTHLGAALEVLDAPWDRLETEVVEPLPAGTIVRADLEGLRPRIAGNGAELEARSVLILPQENDPERVFARLGVFGGSSLRLEFDCPEGFTLGTIQLECQKGNRALLPGHGTAYVDVLLDGETRVREMAVRSGSRETFQVSVRREPSAPSRHTLELRLCSTSSTTLRVYSIAISAWGGEGR